MSDAMVVRTEADYYKPVMSVEEQLYQRQQLLAYVNGCLVESKPGTADGDYGVIPGTGARKVLLLPGAQKLCRMRGLAPDYEILTQDEDWTGERHAGEVFFNYVIKCIIFREDRRMGSGVGACNSFEKKYRYTNAQRVCPACGGAFIFVDKNKGGFFCWKSKGGCGAQFPVGTPHEKVLQSQDAGRVNNPDAADLQNTILKMAKKRAYIDATLSVVGASEFFTQDVETEHKPQERPQPASEEALDARKQEETYEAEYTQSDINKEVAQAEHEQEFGRRPSDVDESGEVEASEQPTKINKAQASALLKAQLAEAGWEPANAQMYMEMLFVINPQLDPIAWKTQNYLDAAALPKQELLNCIKAMQITTPKSPAATIKENINKTEN